MAKVISKGSKIQQTIAMSLTDVAQMVSFSSSGAENETVDTTTLDTSGAGKEYLATGYTEGGSIDFELIFDPALAGHQAITDLLTTPAEVAWKVVFSDTSEYAFTGAGVGLDFTVDMADVIRATGSVKLDQLFTYTT